MIKAFKTMKEIFKKIIIATITLFTALLITVLVTGNNLFEKNLSEIFIYYLAYMIVYVSILLINKKNHTKDS
jgi:hypothetical protein